MSDQPDFEAIEDATTAAIGFMASYQEQTGLSTAHALDAMTLATLELAAMNFGNKPDVIAWMHDVVDRLTRSTQSH